MRRPPVAASFPLTTVPGQASPGTAQRIRSAGPATPRLPDTGGAGGGPTLYALRVGETLRFLTQQPLSFWLICAYLLFEYVRPQSIYPWMAVVPWSSLSYWGALLALILEHKGFRTKSPANTVLIIFTLVALASIVTAVSRPESIPALTVLMAWVLIYFLLTNIVINEQRLLVFILMFLLYNLKMALHAVRSWASIGFGYDRYGMMGAPGWFQNSGELGIEMTVFLPIAVFFYAGLSRHWGKIKRLSFLVMPASALLGMVAATERSTMLGGMAVLMWFVAKSRYRFRALLVSAVVTVVLWNVIPDQQVERFRASGEDQTSQLRLIYWGHGVEITNDNPLLGIGLGNWLAYYTSHYPAPWQLPHNIFIQASAELGYTGLAVFLALIGVTFVINARTRRMMRAIGPPGSFMFSMAHGLDGALVGFLVTGFFITVLYYPYFWINLALTVALHEAARRKAAEVLAATAAAAPRTGVVVSPSPASV